MLTKFKFNINRMDYFQRNVNYKIDFKIDLKNLTETIVFMWEE